MAGPGGKDDVRKSVATSSSGAKKESIKPGDSVAKKASLRPGAPTVLLWPDWEANSRIGWQTNRSRYTLDPLVPPKAPAIMLWPDGKPILGSDGKPINPTTLTIVVGADGKSVVHGPDGKTFLLPDGKPLDPALLPPKEPPLKPYVGVPLPRFLIPPWENPPRNKWPNVPCFTSYTPVLMKALKLELPAQVEFQDGGWTRTMINLKKEYPKFVRVHLGPVK
ncbi:hypothetical protein R1sor_003474 [Riccia sorocarpa]|uniref:Uncharacterized protein n=1 Tax=Riccia sorocarpa TaxID=122646 RepID=A0ABD3H4F6_9MARC